MVCELRRGLEKTWGERVDLLLASEATETVLSLHDDQSEGAVLATYSLQGLGDAYEAIREACPERETPNDLFVTGEVVRVEPYVEVAFTGPFAEAGRNERISVKIFPHEWADEEYDWPERGLAAFAAGDDSFPGVRHVDRLEYSRDNTLLGEAYGTYYLYFRGVCLDPGSGRIKTTAVPQTSGQGELQLIVSRARRVALCL